MIIVFLKSPEIILPQPCSHYLKKRYQKCRTQGEAWGHTHQDRHSKCKTTFHVLSWQLRNIWLLSEQHLQHPSKLSSQVLKHNFHCRVSLPTMPHSTPASSEHGTYSFQALQALSPSSSCWLEPLLLSETLNP